MSESDKKVSIQVTQDSESPIATPAAHSDRGLNKTEGDSGSLPATVGAPSSTSKVYKGDNCPCPSCLGDATTKYRGVCEGCGHSFEEHSKAGQCPVGVPRRWSDQKYRTSTTQTADKDLIRLFHDQPPVDRAQADYLWHVLGGFLGKPAPTATKERGLNVDWERWNSRAMLSAAQELLDEIDGQAELGGPTFEAADPLREAIAAAEKESRPATSPEAKQDGK